MLKPEISSSTLPDAVVAHMLSDEQIARRAYALWESRGRPFGTPEEDWYRAMQELHASVGSAQK